MSHASWATIRRYQTMFPTRYVSDVFAALDGSATVFFADGDQVHLPAPSKGDADLIRVHAAHGWKVSPSMATIQRVPRAAKEQIMTCTCGWYGWVSRAALSSDAGVES